MVRAQPLERPATGPVRDAATAALGRPVAAVEPQSDAVYALELGSGETARLRLATDERGGTRLAEPRLLSSLAGVDGLPTPELLAAVGPDTSPFGVAFSITSVGPGQRLRDVLDLPDAAHEALVREAGRHLAVLHNADIDARVPADGGPYGDLRVPDRHPTAPLTVVTAGSDDPGRERWPDRTRLLTERVAARLRGTTPTSAGGEFADLAPAVRDGITAAALPERPPAAPLHLDYRPANLVFEPGTTWPAHAQRESRVVRTVRAFAAPETGDGLLDLAFAEDALVGLPLGGTDRGRRLAAVLREAYVAERGVDTPFGERYAAYLLLARARLLASTEDHHRLTREREERAAATRCRERIETLVDELR